MKKLLVLLFFVPIISFAQFTKGNKFIGGNVSYSRYSYEGGTDSKPFNSIFDLEGQLGFFSSESFAVGPVLNIFSQSRPSINPVTNLFEQTNSSGVMAGVFARKYFPISEMFLFSMEGKVLGGIRSSDNDSEDESNGQLKVGFRPVFTFLPSSKWGFEAGVGNLSYEVNTANYLSDQTVFLANLGQVSLGVVYFFNRTAE
ncbi:MAG TPA: hypothetical protein VLA71_15050 [Algoriphagus sp.]|nr:hypothetical protein [Algoriphagus sp.]